jgi:phosphoribosylanthranilate isomerase
MDPLPFRIKICGVRSLDDVMAVGKSNADAVGLNFYPKSIRVIEIADAPSISEMAKALGLCRVGLFVNATLEEIVDRIHTVGLDVIQLHGDETVDFARRLRDATSLPLVRAVRLPHRTFIPEAIAAATSVWLARNFPVLLDADVGSTYGGAGAALDWQSIRRWASDLNKGRENWILAGGLSGENVADAIEQSGAISVDVASGVEAPRGVKNPEKIRHFASQASKALAL